MSVLTIQILSSVIGAVCVLITTLLGVKKYTKANGKEAQEAMQRSMDQTVQLLNDNFDTALKSLGDNLDLRIAGLEKHINTKIEDIKKDVVEHRRDVRDMKGDLRETMKDQDSKAHKRMDELAYRLQMLEK